MLTDSRFCREGSPDVSVDPVETVKARVAVVFSTTVKAEPLNDRKSTFGPAEKKWMVRRILLCDK